MKYTLEELHDIILPMVQSLGSRPAEELADSLVDLIKQDREAQSVIDSDTSDGFHTFKELYRYRMLLQAAWFNSVNLGKLNHKKIVKSWRHHDGELCFGKENYFIVVAELPTGQISNHYKGEYWDLFNCAEVERAPEWDGHTPEQAADRIEQYVRGNY